ncbi:MAG TPA: glycosyltransferase family 39 protein [bacterium]|nr:glycosyltransferase family 39 protein [bacterium]
MKRNEPARLALVFLIAFGFRAVMVGTIPEIRISSDSEDYLALAESLRTEGAFARDGRPETYRTPGYPCFLFLARFLGMEPPRGIALAQAVLSALGVMLTFTAAERLFGGPAAWTAVLLLSAHPTELFSVTSLLTESLFAFVLTVIVWSVAAGGNQRTITAFSCGCLAGVACLIRPVAAWLFVPMAVVFVLGAKGFRERLAVGILCLAGGILFQGGWMWRNHERYGSFYLTEIPAAALYVYWAQSAQAWNTGESEEALQQQAWNEWDEARGRLDPLAMNHEFTQRARRMLEEHYTALGPVWARGMIRQVVDSSAMKLIERYRPDWPLEAGQQRKAIRDPESFSQFVVALGLGTIRALELALTLVLYLTGLVSLWRWWKKRPERFTRNLAVGIAGLLVAALVLVSATPAANERFRAQYLPLLVLLASSVLVDWARSVAPWFHRSGFGGSRVQLWQTEEGKPSGEPPLFHRHGESN